MQPQQGLPPKTLARFGFVLLAVAALTLPTAASAVQGAKPPKPPKPPKYKVLVVTAGDKKSDLNKAGVKAIKKIGQDNGHEGRPERQVHGRRRTGRERDQGQVHRRRSSRSTARSIFLDTAAAALLTDEQKAAFEAYFHAGGGFLAIGSAIETEPGWQFYTDLLGARASTTLARRVERRRHEHQGRGRRRLRRRQHDHDRHRREQRAGDDPDRRHCGSGRNRHHPDRAAHHGPRDRRDRAADQGGRPVGDDQGRRPRPRRDEGPAASTGTGPTPGTTSRRTSAASRTSSPRSSRIRSARSRRARCSTGSPAARWAPTIRSPGARTTRAAAPSTPRCGNTAASFDEANFRTHLERRDRLGGRRRRPGLQRLRRDRAGELPAGQDQRAAEPERADRLRPAPRRAGHPDRPPRRRASAQPGDRHVAAHRRLRRRDHAAHAADLHAQRGRHVRPGHRPQLLDEQVGLPLLRPADRRQHHLLRRDDGTHQRLRRGLRPVEQRGPDPGRQHLRLRLLDRVLPAVAVQVRRRRPGQPGAPRPGERAADPARHGEPRRLLPRGRRPRLGHARQPLARDRRRHAPPAAATPATGVRASTSGPTRTRRSA